MHQGVVRRDELQFAFLVVSHADGDDLGPRGMDPVNLVRQVGDVVCGGWGGQYILTCIPFKNIKKE